MILKKPFNSIKISSNVIRVNEKIKKIGFGDFRGIFSDNFDPFVQMTKSLYRAGRLDEISEILERTEKNNLRAYNDAAFNFAKGLLSW